MTFGEMKKKNVAEIVRAPFGDDGGRVSYYPRYIQLEHSSFCNAQCIMCNHFYLGNRGAKHLPREVTEILDPVFPYVEMIMLNGDGEPFLHPLLRDFTRQYQKYGIIVSSNTNLGLPDLDPGSFKGCFDSLVLSCDGASKETFEMIRRGLSFERFCANARRLREELPEIDLSLDTVLMKENVLEAADIVRLAAELGTASVRFNMLGVNPEIGNGADALWDCMDLAAREMRKARKAGCETGVRTSFPAFIPETFDEDRAAAQEEAVRGMDFPELIEQRRVQASGAVRCDLSQNRLHREFGDSDYRQEETSENRWCSWGLERCYIDLSGNVSTCCFNVHHYMGNLLEAGSFDAVWNGERYAAFRKNMRKGVLPAWCGQCSWRADNASSMAVGKQIPVTKKSAE